MAMAQGMMSDDPAQEDRRRRQDGTDTCRAVKETDASGARSPVG